MLLVMLHPKFDIWLDSSIDPSIHYPKFFARLILQPILVKRHIFALIFHCKNGSIWVKMVAIMWKGKHLGIQFSNNFSSPIEYEYPFASNNRTTNIGWLTHPNPLTVNLLTHLPQNWISFTDATQNIFDFLIRINSFGNIILCYTYILSQLIA